MLLEKMEEVKGIDEVDHETTRMAQRMAIPRISTKHTNMWMRQLEMKRKEMCELAGLMGIQEVKKEISEEKNMERWARRCSNFFTKKVKKMLLEEIDNAVLTRKEKEITGWCNRNKVYDEITDNEIEEMWERETQCDGEAIRLNGKYVWETAKRV